MRTLALCALLATLLAPTPATADFFVSWDGCEPDFGSNRDWSATDHVLTVFVKNVQGDFNAVDFVLAVDGRCAATSQFIPEAWRFDPDGCQAGMLRVERPSGDEACPGLTPGLGGVELTTVSPGFVYPGTGMHPGVIEVPAILIRVAHSFPLTNLEASKSYVVAKIRFDMSSTVAGADPSGKLCGCGSTPIGLQVVTGNLEGPFGPLTVYGENWAGWNDYFLCIVGLRTGWKTSAAPAGDPSCLTTAVQPSTWGQLKASYR
jgi:hypothetical protein